MKNFKKIKKTKIEKKEHGYKFIFNQFMEYDNLKKNMAIITNLIEN